MRCLVYSHVFIAICALALTLETILVYKLPIDSLMLYLGLVFFSTLMTYSAKSIQGIYTHTIEESNDRKNWVSNHKMLVKVLFFLSIAFVILFSFWITNKVAFLLLIFLGMLSLGYSFSFKIGTKKVVLREIPFFKTVLVALVWTMVVAYIPFIVSDVSVVGFRVVEVFIFLFSLAILFDIKDVSVDERMRIKTIPIQIGINGTKTLSVSLLLSWGVLVFMLGEELRFLSLFLSIIFAIFIIVYVKLERKAIFYMFWIDGLMVVKVACLILYYNIRK